MNFEHWFHSSFREYIRFEKWFWFRYWQWVSCRLLTAKTSVRFHARFVKKLLIMLETFLVVAQVWFILPAWSFLWSMIELLKGCYNRTEDFFLPCPNGYNLCATKMAVDWFSGGNQEIKFTRMCSNKNVEFGQECMEGGNRVGLFKDCETSCNTPNCNNMNDVEMLFSAKDENGDPRELHCYEYSMDKFSESGLSSYENNDVPNSDWYVRKCPRWANQGCFRGNSIAQGTDSLILNIHKA